jgi:hypothetical protein
MGEFVSAKVRISEAQRRARAWAQTSSPGSFRTRLGASWRRWKITTSATVNCWGNQRSCSNFCVVTGVATELGAEGAVSTLLAALAVMAAARWRRLGLTPLSDSIKFAGASGASSFGWSAMEDDRDIGRMWWGDSSLDNPAGPSAGQTLDLSFMNLVSCP